MQNTQVIESWKPKTPQEVPRSKKDENINQIYDCEESERKSEIQTTRPTTKYEEKRTRPEDCIRVNTALPGRRRLLVSRQGHNPDKFIFDNQMSRGQACPTVVQCPTGSVSPRAPSRFIVRRHSLSQLHRKEVQNQNNKFISSTGDHIHNGLTKTLPSIKEPYSIRGRF